MKPTCKHKINLISLSDKPGGAENVLLQMAVSVGGEFIFVTKSKDIRLDIPDTLRCKYLSKKSIFFGMINLIPVLKKLNKDEIIMSTHPYLNAYLGFFKRIGFLKTQLIVRECTSVFTRFSGVKKLAYQIIYRVGYPAVDLVICQTDVMRTQLMNHNRYLDSARVIVQPNPVDVEKMILLGDQQLLEMEKIDEFICTAGRLIPEKGFDILIKAFEIVYRSYPHLKLYLLGEGKEKQALTQLIADYNLQNAVLLKGYIANPAPYFKNAKLCVVSSITEGFPNVLLEMMALNSAIVSTICAGGITSIPNITTVGVNNIEALAIAMLETLKNKKTELNPHVDYLLGRSPKNFAKSTLSALAQL